MAPRFSSSGASNRYEMKDQRRWFFPMDAFVQECNKSY